MSQPAERLVDTAAGSSMLFAGVSLASVNEIVQIVAGIFAVLAGAVSVWYYVSKIRQGRERMDWEREDRRDHH